MKKKKHPVKKRKRTLRQKVGLPAKPKGGTEYHEKDSRDLDVGDLISLAREIAEGKLSPKAAKRLAANAASQLVAQRHMEEDERRQALLDEMRKEQDEYPVLEPNFEGDNQRRAVKNNWPILSQHAKEKVVTTQYKIATDEENQKSTVAANFLLKLEDDKSKTPHQQTNIQDNRSVEVNVNEIPHANYVDLVRQANAEDAPPHVELPPPNTPENES